MIEWVCEVCRRAIDDGSGYVTINQQTVDERARRLAEWTAKHERGGLVVVSVADLADCPSAVSWQILHSACDPSPESPDYWIAVERIRSASDVLRWTSQLMEKDWLRDTNWERVLGRVAAQLSD